MPDPTPPLSPDSSPSAAAHPDTGFAQAVFEQSTLSTIVCDPGGHIIVGNQAFERLFGLRIAELPRSYSVRTDPQLAEQGVLPLVERAFAGETIQLPAVRYQERAVLGVTTSTWTQAHLYPLRAPDGTVTAVVLVHVDLTARMDTEGTLRTSEARLRMALDAGGMGAWEWTIAEGVVRWSETLERIHGLEPGTFGGTFEDYQSDMHPDDRERVLATVQDTLSGATHDITYRIVRPDGETRWLTASGQLLRDDRGAPLRLIGVCMDVTERRQRDETSAMLTEAGIRLASSLDYDSTLAAVAELAVPALADYCVIDLLEAPGGATGTPGSAGSVRRVATAHVDPEKDAILRGVRQFAPRLDVDGLVARTLSTGEPQVASPIVVVAQQAGAEDKPGYLALLQSLAPEAALCVPLIARGMIIGSLLLVSAGSGRRYGDSQVSVAAELARRAALAIENARLHQQALLAREASERAAAELEAILSSISDPFVVYDSEWRFRYVNDAARSVFRMTGGTDAAGGDALGSKVWDLYPYLHGTGLERMLRQAAAERTALTFEEYAPHRGSWNEVHCYPMPEGRLAVSWRDITARKRAEEADHFLGEAAAILATSLDHPTTLAALARLVVPQLADWCAVDLGVADEYLERVATAHVEPAKLVWAEEFNRRYPTHPSAPTGVANVMRTGVPEMISDITDDMLVAGLPDPDHLAMVRTIGLRSIIIVPLMARGRTLGALTLAAAESGRRYDDADLQLAEELARRAALAVDNARLHNLALDAQRAAAAQALYAERFRRAQASAPDAFALFDAVRDADGEVVDFVWEWANPAALRVQGTTLEMLQGQRMLERNPGIAATPLMRGYVLAMESGVPYEDEVRYQHEWIDTWFRISAVPVDGGLAVTFADVTARKRAENRAMSLHELTRTLAMATSRAEIGSVVLERALPALGASIGSLLELDAERQEFTLISERGFDASPVWPWQRYSVNAGTPEADAVRSGAIASVASPEEWKARYPQHAPAAEAGGIAASVVVPLRLGERTLGIVALQFGVPRVLDEDESVFLYAFANQCAQALERVRLFEAERRVREDLARVFAQAPAAIALTRGPDHVFQIANPLYESLVGRSGLVGVPARVALPDLEGQDYFELLDQVLATGQPHVATETPVSLERGNAWFTFVFQPVKLAGDEVDGVAIVAADVTSQVRGRQEADRLREEAEAANRSKTEFMASMSHELRTPLNAIGGYADLLLLGVRGPLTDVQRLDVERINRSQRHLLGVINDILNFARVEAGYVDYVLQPVDVDAVIGEVVPLVLPQLNEKQLHFTLAAGTEGLMATADPEKMRQVLLNLLANAIKFTPADGRVAITVSGSPDVVRVSVSDSGIGIPQDRLASVFEPFVQLQRSVTRPAEGTGLGLAISRDLARGMHGELTATSTIGEGSMFTLTLPRHASPD